MLLHLLFQPNRIFGHGGYGGQYAAADVENKVSFAYTTSFLDPMSSYTDNGDERLYSLVRAVYDSVFQIENCSEKWQLFPFYSQFKSYMDENEAASKLWRMLYEDVCKKRKIVVLTDACLWFLA